MTVSSFTGGEVFIPNPVMCPAGLGSYGSRWSETPDGCPTSIPPPHAAGSSPIKLLQQPSLPLPSAKGLTTLKPPIQSLCIKCTSPSTAPDLVQATIHAGPRSNRLAVPKRQSSSKARKAAVSSSPLANSLTVCGT